MKPTIEYADFEKLEIRVGQVVSATAPEWSNKLLQFVVDFGAVLGERTIFSGVRKWYLPEMFIGKKYCFVINLAERKMGEGVSQGMMLMVDGSEQPFPIEMPAAASVGEIVR